MSFTRSTTDISVHQKLGDYPNQDNGLTPEELKKRYDYPAETLQKDLNRLEEELEDINASTKIGADALDENDDSENNVLSKLRRINAQLKSVILNQIPDGTITKNKLDPKYESSLARKENLGKLYLASQYRTPEIETETPQEYILPKLTVDSHVGYEATWSYHTKSGVDNAYDMFNGDGNGYIKTPEGTALGPKNAEIKIELPYYLKMENISFTGNRAYLKIYGSNNNSTWVRIDDDSIYEYNDGENYKFNKTISTKQYYKYIRLQLVAPIPGRGGHIATIYNDISIRGKILTSLEQNKMAILAKEENEILNQYENGQIIKLNTPTNFIEGLTISSKLKVYELEEKNVPNDLVPNKRYSLVYDGEKFVHESEVQNG